MSSYVESPTKAYSVSGALGQYLRVKRSSGNLALAGLADKDWLGEMEIATFAGATRGTVRLRTAQGTRKMVANGAVTVDAWVFTAAAGKISATESTGYPVGIAQEAATADDDIIEVLPCSDRLDRYGELTPIVYEFDCDGDNGDVLEHILIPAAKNPSGLLILGVFGLISEVMAGSSEDQGIVTIEDEDDNAICTLTPSDAAADALNDVVVGTLDLYSASTGDAAKVVAANKAVQGYVSQQTSGGTPAGKIKVYVRAIPWA